MFNVPVHAHATFPIVYHCFSSSAVLSQVIQLLSQCVRLFSHPLDKVIVFTGRPFSFRCMSTCSTPCRPWRSVPQRKTIKIANWRIVNTQLTWYDSGYMTLYSMDSGTWPLLWPASATSPSVDPTTIERFPILWPVSGKAINIKEKLPTESYNFQLNWNHQEVVDLHRPSHPALLRPQHTQVHWGDHPPINLSKLTFGQIVLIEVALEKDDENQSPQDLGWIDLHW